jgi:hypothetical protein
MITGASRPTGAAYESAGCFVVDLSLLDARSEGPRSIPDGLKGTKSTPSHFIATCRAKASEKGVPRRSHAPPPKSSPHAPLQFLACTRSRTRAVEMGSVSAPSSASSLNPALLGTDLWP